MEQNSALDETLISNYNRWVVDSGVYIINAVHTNVSSVPRSNIAPPAKDVTIGCPLAKFAFYDKIPLDIPSNRILSPTGVEEFRNFVSDNIGLAWRYTDVTDTLGLEYENHEHRIEVHGKMQKCGGRFVNRFCQWYVSNNGGYRELSDTFKEELNNFLNPFWIGGDYGNNRFFIDIVDHIDWRSGAFGEKGKEFEEGSCWWYHGGLDSDESIVTKFCALMPHKALGIRLWIEDDNDYRGVGRIWVIRNNEHPIFFNGYGFSPAAWVTHLAPIFDFKRWKRISLSLDRRYFPENTVNKDIGFYAGITEDAHELTFARQDFHWENTLWFQNNTERR